MLFRVNGRQQLLCTLTTLKAIEYVKLVRQVIMISDSGVSKPHHTYK